MPNGVKAPLTIDQRFGSDGGSSETPCTFPGVGTILGAHYAVGACVCCVCRNLLRRVQTSGLFRLAEPVKSRLQEDEVHAIFAREHGAAVPLALCFVQAPESVDS